MSLTLQISDEAAALLEQQAKAHGLSIDAWVEELARHEASVNQRKESPTAQQAIEDILSIQKRVQPDPEGWTTRDYIKAGRR